MLKGKILMAKCFTLGEMPYHPKMWENQVNSNMQCLVLSAYFPGKSRGRRSLVGCSLWGCQESDTTKRLHFHFSLSCIGEGNGNPLQCSCLENPRDGGAWWAAIYGVAQSRTRLKRLSNSSSSSLFPMLSKLPVRIQWI